MSKQLGREIYVKDRVVVRDAAVKKIRSLYPNADLETAFTVIGENNGYGRRALQVDRAPFLLWVGQVKLAWPSVDCKERIKALGL
jgi:hypothetical protein